MIDGGDHFGVQKAKLQPLFKGIQVLLCLFIPFDIQRI